MLPRYPETLALSEQRQPEAAATRCSTGEPGVRPLRQPERLPRRARSPAAPAICRLIQAAERSLMATGAMLWGGAAYNNGILPFKNYLLGEAYTRDGEPARASRAPVKVDRGDEGARACCRGTLSAAGLGDGAAGRHLPRVRARRAQHHHASSRRSACPTPPASSSGWRSRAGPTSASRTAARAPACASRSRCSTSTRRASTTRSPGSWAPTTSRATTAPRAAARCHVVYANDRDPRHSGPYARVRPRRHDADRRPDDPQGRARPPAPARVHPRHPDQPVHDLPHAPAEHVREHLPRLHDVGLRVRRAVDVAGEAEVTRAAPRSATSSTATPRGRRSRGMWGDLEFLQQGLDRRQPEGRRTPSSPTITATAGTSAPSSSATARAICSTRTASVVPDDEPDKFKRAVHLSSIHVDVGMQCVDCHFAQDSARQRPASTARSPTRSRSAARTATAPPTRYPTLRTSRPGGAAAGHRPDAAAHAGRPAALRVDAAASSTSARWSTRSCEWQMSLVKDTVDPASPATTTPRRRAPS